MSDNTVKVWKLFSSQAILAGASAESTSISVKRNHINGNFGIQLEVTGDGVVTVSYELSINDGADYIPADSAGSDVLTGFTKTSGPNADGKFMYPIFPMVATDIKITITETGGADAVAASLWLAAQ